MKRIHSATICCALAIALAAPAAGDGGAWQLKKKKDGIEVYVRKGPGSEMREYRGVMTVAGARLSSFVAVLEDAASYPRWMHSCAEGRVVRTVSRMERYTYVRTSAPWPVWDRDIVYYSAVRQDPATLAVTITASGRPDEVPHRERVVRMPKSDAIWTFAPLPGGEVRVELWQHAEPGGSLPDGLAALAEVDIPYYTLVKIRAIVQEPRYAAASYPEIREPRPR